MSISRTQERKILAKDEFELVQDSHHPEVEKLSLEELQELVKRIRKERDKARDIARQQRREMRGKADARGATPAQGNAGTVVKKQVFANALKRANSQLSRLQFKQRKQANIEAMQQALANKKAANANKVKVASGRTANKGITPKTNPKRTVDLDPREKGRVSQAVKKAQAKRDKK